MASKYWKSINNEILDDKLINQLPDDLWRKFIELLLLATTNGVLPSSYNAAWKLHIHYDKMLDVYKRLYNLGLIGFHNNYVDAAHIPKSVINKYRVKNTLTKSRRMRREINASDVKKRLIDERGAYCENCGKHDDYLELDHIIPLWNDGDNEDDNFQLLCYECHSNKTKLDMQKYYESRRLNGKR
jgi:hypothetical protein